MEVNLFAAILVHEDNKFAATLKILRVVPRYPVKKLLSRLKRNSITHSIEATPNAM